MKSDISGFPEFLPSEQIAFNKAVDTIRSYFEAYGFVPMDTAAVERIDTLLSKGNDKEIYGLYRISDEDSKKELGLRFDLTVPLARYITSNGGQLLYPFKRYQIGPVWRGERPQFGRYRQFYQCDIDIIGDEELSIAYDAEVIAVVTEILTALKIPKFVTKINNRKILINFLDRFVPAGKIPEAVILVDKMGKISPEEFEKSILALGVEKDSLIPIRKFLSNDQRKENADILLWLKQLSFSPEFNEGIAELEEVLQLLKKMDIDNHQVKISLNLARGLNYYTGNIFETTLVDYPDIGSISGGGRYERLMNMVGSQKQYPGVGATIGISRLFTKLLEKEIVKCESTATAEVLVTVQNRKLLSSYMRLANDLRRVGIKAETFLQEKSLGAQMSYASRRGFKFVVIANEVELLEGKAILRNLETKEQKTFNTKYVTRSILVSFNGTR